MKHVLIITLFLLLSSLIFAQSKYAKKSQKLYEKGQYDKCISKTKQYLQKEKKSDELQSYIVLSYNSLFNEAPNENKKYSLLKKTLNEWEKLIEYSNESNKYSELKDLVKISTKTLGDFYEEKNTSKALFCHSKLAELFNDTTKFYLANQSQHNETDFKFDIDDLNLNAYRKSIIASAVNVLGVKYKYGGTDTTGFDCSGFTQYVYNSAGIVLPHNANDQSKLGEEISIEEAQPGDLIFFGKDRVYHAGMIYANNDGNVELIHCVSGGVKHQMNEDENTKYWLGREFKIKRFAYEPTDIEIELYNEVMKYRKSYNLPEIPLSKNLTFVAKTHVRDLAENNPVNERCNLHSWSDKGNWQACCYTSDHANAKCLWNKPSELTTYNHPGYEIAASFSIKYTAKQILEIWKNSVPHNEVIINKGVWDFQWNAIGIGIYENYAVIWFGKEEDK